MDINHRYLWDTNFVVGQLREHRLSEAAIFRYFLAVMSFDWLQLTLIATIPSSSVSAWSTAGAWATFGITIGGLGFLYVQNGGATGHYFLQRYFPLSATVGWKFVVAMLAAQVLPSYLLTDLGPEILDGCMAVALALINIVMFWRIGAYLSKLADDMPPN